MLEQCPFVTFEPEPTTKVTHIQIYPSGEAEKVEPHLFVGKFRASCKQCLLEEFFISAHPIEPAAIVTAKTEARLFMLKNCPRNASKE
jgi:hypothetical protein